MLRSEGGKEALALDEGPSRLHQVINNHNVAPCRFSFLWNTRSFKRTKPICEYNPAANKSVSADCPPRDQRERCTLQRAGEWSYL